MCDIHWGTIDSEDEEENTMQDIELKSSWSNIELPPLYQPCTSSKVNKKDSSKRQLSWMKAPLDQHNQNFMLQSIELQHYKKRMRYMLSAARSHQNDSQKCNTDGLVLPSPPLLPKRFCSSEGRLISINQSPSFLCNELSSSSKRKSDNKLSHCPSLSFLMSRQFLMKSIAAVTSHTGFELASESALQTFTDIIVENYGKLCATLKNRLENAPADSNPIHKNRISIGYYVNALKTKHRHKTILFTLYRIAFHAVVKSYQNILDDVLKESSFDSLQSIQEYWLRRIKKVALTLEKENIALLKEYNTLKEGSIKPDIGLVKVE